MKKVNIEYFIVPNILVNTDSEGRYRKSFNTKDLIYLEDISDVENLDSSERIIYATDFTSTNGAWMSEEFNGNENRLSCRTWLRSVAYMVNSDYYGESDWLGIIDEEGYPSTTYSNNVETAFAPCLQLNIQSVAYAKKNIKGIFKISKHSGEDEYGYEFQYHTIKFGEYPNSYVGEELNKKLDNAFSQKDSLKSTGKRYLRFFSEGNHKHSEYCDEFIFEDQKYVRITHRRINPFSNGKYPPLFIGREAYWIKVEPITWVIKNWDDLPKSINKNGTGKAKVMEVRTKDAINCIPFYNSVECENCSMWQNSTIRGYLNGINVNNIKTNGNPEYSSPSGGDFSEANFITEALLDFFSSPEMRRVCQELEELNKNKQ